MSPASGVRNTLARVIDRYVREEEGARFVDGERPQRAHDVNGEVRRGMAWVFDHYVKDNDE